MGLKIIMLDNPILVSDEKIKEGDFVLLPNLTIQKMTSLDMLDYLSSESLATKLIIAGIPELPSIDFSSLSEEDCKKIGWVNVSELSYKYAEENAGAYSIGIDDAYLEGFLKAQSLNDKKFSLDDLERAYDSGRYSVINKDIQETFESFIKSISKRKIFDVEVEMEKDFENHPEIVGNPREEWEYPKIENNSIKITKIY